MLLSFSKTFENAVSSATCVAERNWLRIIVFVFVLRDFSPEEC